MDPRNVFYEHPFATMVSAVFLFTFSVTAFYYLRLIPGVGTTQPKLDELFIATSILFVATAASWTTAILLQSHVE